MKKTRNVCKETPTPFYQLNRETFWMMIDNKILNARSALYFYATLRCNLDTGTGHRIEYDHAANVLGFKKSTIYKAAIALEDAGFLKRNDSGGFIPYLPHIVSQKEFRETEKLRKKEQPFFEELHANIINFMNESGQTPGLAAIWHIYDNLCANRRARAKKLGKWTPETEGRIHIFRGIGSIRARRFDAVSHLRRARSPSRSEIHLAMPFLLQIYRFIRTHLLLNLFKKNI